MHGTCTLAQSNVDEFHRNMGVHNTSNDDLLLGECLLIKFGFNVKDHSSLNVRLERQFHMQLF